MKRKILYLGQVLLFLMVSTSETYAETNTNLESNKGYYLELINKVDNTYTFSQLSNIIKDCEQQFLNSEEIAIALTSWLRENHNIYRDKGAINVNQFRGHIIYCLRKFVPNKALLKYIKSELVFSHEQYNLATAAHTSRIFPEYAEELIPLLTPFLEDAFNEDIDITTFELNYPIRHVTKLKDEVLKTLKHFSERSLIASELLKNIELNSSSNKSDIADKEKQAVIPSCCKVKTVKNNSNANDEVLIPVENRMKTRLKASFFDQNGKGVKFNNLIGKPFVLTFFYTSCTNPLKCAATVSKLAELQKKAASNKLEDKIGIYAMSYDHYIDSPKVIKSYGEIYGITFSENIRFFTTPEGQNYNTLYSQLDIRVNYGSGTINQHGIQLYLFDKKGRIAKIIENEKWTAKQVSKHLFDLLDE